ncbi:MULTISPECIES: hypothetical protein [Pseudomonas]|uniref:hypothetical protein n=1 Tax=Pseudomonas TaxID=286 RepID=UPI00224AACFF|nr:MULTISPECIES: hypothetical protein [unclassified Pseudomonas]MCX2889438.1 hypothetical protein [Pseudomonas sp. DCB_BI]MDH4553180.1 hypothetical protein [Pseudomonas sp. BN607]
MNHEIQRRYARSFSARLYAIDSDRTVPLHQSTGTERWDWGFEPQSGWLMAGGTAPSILLSFAFHSQSEDRLHFHIRPVGSQARKKLGLSRNGYLGFYELAQVSDYWKLEPLELTEHGLICYIRDHEGHRVGAIKDYPHHDQQVMSLLNTRQGETLTFLLQQVD